MTWKLYALCLITASLAGLGRCDALFDNSRLSQGSINFKRVKRGDGDGSLSFRFDVQKPTNVSHYAINSKIRRLKPSVHCQDDTMTLKIKRLGSPPVLVDNGEGPHISMSQLPSKCGFSVKRSRREVHYEAPYLGCYVTHQDGDYILPLRLWGAPMKMSCPTTPLPTVSCFSFGMVVKIEGVTVNELKIKVSGTWRTLSSLYDSCGLATQVFSGTLTLSAPYNKGSCVQIKDKEFALSLMFADVELLVTCPTLPIMTPTIATTTPPSGSAPALWYHWPSYVQNSAFPRPTPASPSSAALMQPQNQKLSLAADTPGFSFMHMYPHFSPYFVYPETVPVTQSTAAPSDQSLQKPQFAPYPFPFLQRVPIVPGVLNPTAPPPATSTVSLVTPNEPSRRRTSCPFFRPILGQAQALYNPKPVTQKPPKPPVRHYPHPFAPRPVLANAPQMPVRNSASLNHMHRPRFISPQKAARLSST